MAHDLGYDYTLIDSGWESRFEGYNGKSRYQNLADLVDYGEGAASASGFGSGLTPLPTRTPIRSPIRCSATVFSTYCSKRASSV